MSEKETYKVNLEAISKEKSLLSITRLLAFDIMNCTYMSIGDFFMKLSADEVQILVNIVQDGDKHENFNDIVLMTVMLAHAEGLEPSTLDVHTVNINKFASFIVCESLYRKGLIRIYRENMSFGDDINGVIAQRL